MPFLTEKRNQLAKQDKSKKGSVDEKIRECVNILNAYPDYYTTSSCSGRVVLWKGSGKKDETQWLKVSHDVVPEGFFLVKGNTPDLVWLRVEPLILHVCCHHLKAAVWLLDIVKPSFKKSCLLTVRNKIIVEVRGSEFLEMPLYREGKLLFAGGPPFLSGIVNQKIKKILESQQRLLFLLKQHR